MSIMSKVSTPSSDSVPLTPKQQQYLDEFKQSYKFPKSSLLLTLSRYSGYLLIFLVGVVHFLNSFQFEIPTAVLNFVGFFTMWYVLCMAVVFGVFTVVTFAAIFSMSHIINNERPLNNGDRESVVQILGAAIKKQNQSMLERVERYLLGLLEVVFIVSLACNAWYVMGFIAIGSFICRLVTGVLAKGLVKMCIKALCPATKATDGEE